MMEKNTVCLDIEVYHKLQQYKKGILEIRNKKILALRGGYSFETLHFFTSDEIIEKAIETSNKHKSELETLQAENKRLEKKLLKFTSNEPKEITIEDIKKMSSREFRKWKKQANKPPECS